MLEINSKKSE